MSESNPNPNPSPNPDPKTEPSSAGAPSRRDFLASVLTAGTAVPAAVGAAAMGLRYVLPPSKMATAEILVCDQADVRVGDYKIFDILNNRICLLRDSDTPPPGEDPKTYMPFRAFSLRCSHLGCYAHWEGGLRKFVCPCHNAVFDEQGKVIAGPPPVGLTRVAIEVRDQQVFMKLPYAKA
jgi:Rieske Fe-S protein